MHDRVVAVAVDVDGRRGGIPPAGRGEYLGHSRGVQWPHGRGVARLQLLGGVRAELGPATLDFVPNRRFQLLAYLAYHGDWQRRDKLAFLFWPDEPNQTARHNLRQLLKYLRRYPWLTTLEAEESRLRWLVSTDVAAFRQALREGAVDEALALYQGPLLAGFDGDEASEFGAWLELERQQLQAQWQEVVLEHAGRLEAAGQFAGAEASLGALLAQDPLDEEALQAYLRAAARAGRQGGALAAYRLFATRLEHELGLAPSPATQRLAQALREADEGALPDSSRLPAPAPPLPMPAAPLVGRDAERREVIRLLAQHDHRLLTITGPGGIGKTSLALAAARELDRHYPDGVRFVPLEAVGSVDALPGAVAVALGLEWQPAADPLAQIARAVGERRMLLVLDNYEQLLERADLPEVLLRRCRHLSVLVTSRERLATAGEVTIELAGLPFPAADTPFETAREAEAIRLFDQAARRRAEAFVLDEANYPGVRQLCELVEGTPLAIEFAAGLAGLLPLSELIERLRANLSLLATESPLAPPRRRSLGAVWEHSWQLLTAGDQRVLSGLAVFQGGFDWKSAERVAGATPLQLGRLVDKSLLRPAGAYRFDFHATLQPFARHKLAADAARAEQTTSAHRAHFLELARRQAEALGGKEARHALGVFDREAANLRSAWEGCADADVLLAFVAALGTYQARRGRWGERLELLERALAAARRQQRPELLPRLHNLAAAAHQQLGDLQRAEELLRASLRDQGEAPTAVLAEAVNELGGVHYQRREFEQALGCFERARELYRTLGEVQGEADELNNIGATYYQQGELQRAIAVWKEALTLQRRVRDAGQQALLLNNLGSAYQLLGDLEEALVFFERSEALCREVGDDAGAVLALGNLGSIHFLRGDFDRSLELNRAILARQLAFDDPGGRALTLNNIAMIFERRGALDEAQARLDEALALQEHLDDRTHRVITLYNLSTVARQQGRPERAEVLARQALELAEETDNPVAQAYALNFLGDARRDLGAFGVAEDAYRRAVGIQQRVADKVGLALSYANLAELGYRRRDYAAAERWAEASLELAGPLGLRPNERAAKRLLALARQASGRLERLAPLWKEVIDLDDYLRHPELETDRRLLEQMTRSGRVAS